MRIAVRVEAQRRAREEVKAQIRREGRVKLSEVPSREITMMAEAAVIADAAFRAKLIAEAKRVVEQWRVEGFFGKGKAGDARTSFERNSCTEWSCGMIKGYARVSALCSTSGAEGHRGR